MAYSQLQASVQVQLDGSGNGSAQIGPQITREHWNLVSGNVSVATNVNEATCVLYMASGPSPTAILGSTATGSTGDTCGLSGVSLLPGQVVLAQWKGGDANAFATLALVGTTGRPDDRPQPRRSGPHN